MDSIYKLLDKGYSEPHFEQRLLELIRAEPYLLWLNVKGREYDHYNDSIVWRLVNLNVEPEIIYLINGIIDDHARKNNLRASELSLIKSKVFEKPRRIGNILEKRSFVEIMNLPTRTPLMQTVYMGRLELLKALVNVSPNPDILSLVDGIGRELVIIAFNRYFDGDIDIETTLEELKYLADNSPDGPIILLSGVGYTGSHFNEIRLKLVYYIEAFGPLVERYPEIRAFLTKRQIALQSVEVNGETVARNIDIGQRNREIIEDYLWQREQRMLEETFEYLRSGNEDEEMTLPQLVASVLPQEHQINRRLLN